jgi:hypothetical protein
MEATVESPQEISQLRELVQRSGKHRNLKLDVLRAEDGKLLVVVCNRNAASAYRLEPGWLDRFTRDLDGGLFG